MKVLKHVKRWIFFVDLLSLNAYDMCIFAVQESVLFHTTDPVPQPLVLLAVMIPITNTENQGSAPDIVVSVEVCLFVETEAGVERLTD